MRWTMMKIFLTIKNWTTYVPSFWWLERFKHSTVHTWPALVLPF